MSKTDEEKEKPVCRIAEILQWSCDIEKSKSEKEKNAFHCYPVPRIFRVCPGRPAIEITQHITIDTETGEVEIPLEAQQTLPKGKIWWDVIRKNGSNTADISKSHQVAKSNPAV